MGFFYFGVGVMNYLEFFIYGVYDYLYMMCMNVVFYLYVVYVLLWCVVC